MSHGYASRLSEYPNKGVVGLPEQYDSERVLTMKLRKLTAMVKAAERLVFLTGAGISTAANIPDFRGPNGIWTLEKKKMKKRQKLQKQKGVQERDEKCEEVIVHRTGRKRQKLSSSETELPSSSSTPSMNFADAKPTLTHRAITFLAQQGKMDFCISQNVDGLHRRSGLSRDLHVTIHGCVFTEKCRDCEAEFFRDFDVGGMSFQPTGRKCEVKGCDGNLHDTLLDWEDPLDEKDLQRAELEADQADLMICLGTSLRIQPIGSLPLRAKRFIIVNLQTTPFDSDASLIIRAPVDKVLDCLLKELGSSDWESESPPPIERKWERKDKKESESL